MSLIVSGPVPEVSCEGDAAGGEPAVEAVDVFEGVWRRARIWLRTGRVSIESGDRPSGRFMSEVG